MNPEENQQPQRRRRRPVLLQSIWTSFRQSKPKAKRSSASTASTATTTTNNATVVSYCPDPPTIHDVLGRADYSVQELEQTYYSTKELKGMIASSMMLGKHLQKSSNNKQQSNTTFVLQWTAEDAQTPRGLEWYIPSSKQAFLSAQARSKAVVQKQQDKAYKQLSQDAARQALKRAQQDAKEVRTG